MAGVPLSLRVVPMRGPVFRSGDAFGGRLSQKPFRILRSHPEPGVSLAGPMMSH